MTDPILLLDCASLTSRPSTLSAKSSPSNRNATNGRRSTRRPKRSTCKARGNSTRLSCKWNLFKQGEGSGGGGGGFFGWNWMGARRVRFFLGSASPSLSFRLYERNFLDRSTRLMIKAKKVSQVVLRVYCPCYATDTRVRRALTQSCECSSIRRPGWRA